MGTLKEKRYILLMGRGNDEYWANLKKNCKVVVV
jgi:hypothetical protein